VLYSQGTFGRPSVHHFQFEIQEKIEQFSFIFILVYTMYVYILSKLNLLITNQNLTHEINSMLHSKKTPVLGYSNPVLGVKLKRRYYVFW